MKKTTSFRIDEELKAFLEDEAIEKRISFAALIHGVLEDWRKQRQYIPLRLSITSGPPRILILPDVTADELRKAAALKMEMDK